MVRGAVVGTGFWSRYQIAAWKELQEVEIVAVYNRTAIRAEQTAAHFQIPMVYGNAEEMLKNERLHFVDIISDVDTHETFTLLAAKYGVNIICQKPMAPTLDAATRMVATCIEKGVRFFVHENFRWQAPIRALKAALDSHVIGKPFKARVSFVSAFPVYDNQPFLRELTHFILTDVGSHVLDVCRFLFGEVSSLFCLTKRVNKQINGEDVANVMMEMKTGLHCYAEMSYASLLEKENFPQTLILVEGERGSLHLTSDFELKVTTQNGTTSSFVRPKLYKWADPAYAVVHSSIVDCNSDILTGIKGGKSEMTGEDNLRTVQLVWACYESAATKKAILL
jgi:D-apiose dehydrogenase